MTHARSALTLRSLNSFPLRPGFPLPLVLPMTVALRKYMALTSFHRWHSCLCARSSEEIPAQNWFLKSHALKEVHRFLKNITDFFKYIFKINFLK